MEKGSQGKANAKVGPEKRRGFYRLPMEALAVPGRRHPTAEGTEARAWAGAGGGLQLRGTGRTAGFLGPVSAPGVLCMAEVTASCVQNQLSPELQISPSAILYPPLDAWAVWLGTLSGQGWVAV